MISRESIESIVLNGLVKDIFKMEQAFELLKIIGEKSGELNYSHLRVYNELFGTFQSALEVQAILAAARIYDKPSKKYPTRCLLGVLEYIKINKSELPSIREPNQLSYQLKSIKAPNELIDLAENESIEFAEKFYDFTKELLSKPCRVVALKKLKTFRDKSLAHNESIKQIKGPKWNELKDLINISKNVVGILGWDILVPRI